MSEDRLASKFRTKGNVTEKYRKDKLERQQ